MSGFDWGEPIYAYSRSQAIDDGVLDAVTDLVPDEPDFARSAGFKVPVALTAAVTALVVPTDEEAADWAQDLKGRLWDVLMMARFAAARSPRGGAAVFLVSFRLAGRENTPRPVQRDVRLKLVISGGDQGEPVATIMLPEED